MLALRFAAGLSASEIAAVLGKREEAVRKRLARAMQTLKERSHAVAR
jgi:DNA-directed RNA polymerase specialized sigma24 family protein